MSELDLPGNVQPLYSATAFARVDGYVDSRMVDIGSAVTNGQVLAVISTPEIDQQLLQARATREQADAALLQAQAALEQAQANEKLARLTKERDLPLGKERAISQQVVDEAVLSHQARQADVSAATASVAAAKANVDAAAANVARLEQMQSFQKVLAPFDGVITKRNVERGDLVKGGSANAGKPLFAIAQSNVVRVQVDVPQSDAVNIHDGDKATLDIKERFGRKYTGTVTRTASALDGTSRTMLTEVQVDNRDHSLLPGMYAQVKFTLPNARTLKVIPTSSLVFDHSGTRVASITADNTVHFLPVVIGQDLGTEVQIISGLVGGESLVANPSDLLVEGQTVTVH